MIRKMGPMKNYSCRSTERTIKTFTYNVKSTTHPGVNSSNLLLRGINMQQTGLQEALNTSESSSSNMSDGCNILSLENDDTSQLWYASQQRIILEQGDIIPNLSHAMVKTALVSYYQRVNGTRHIASLGQIDITIAGKMWLNSNVYSSKMYRNKHHQITAADNYVLFEAGRYRR